MLLQNCKLLMGDQNGKETISFHISVALLYNDYHKKAVFFQLVVTRNKIRQSKESV